MGINTPNTTQLEPITCPTPRPPSTRTDEPSRNRPRPNPTPPRHHRLLSSSRNQAPPPPRLSGRRTHRFHPHLHKHKHSRNSLQLGTRLLARSHKPRNRPPRLSMPSHPLHRPANKPRGHVTTPQCAVNYISCNGQPSYESRHHFPFQHRYLRHNGRSVRCLRPLFRRS